MRIIYFCKGEIEMLLAARLRASGAIFGLLAGFGRDVRLAILRLFSAAASTGLRPARLIDLASARDRKRICGNIFRDDRSGGDVRAVADRTGATSAESLPMKTRAANRGLVFGHAIVVAGDRAGADIRAAPMVASPR